MLMATCMQRSESRAAVLVVQGADVGPVFARRRCRTEPASSHSERRSSSPLAPPPAKQVPGGFSMLMETCMQRGESRAAVMMVQGAAAGPVYARRRCRTEPASSHSERRSSSPLAPPPARQVPGSFSMLTATCMQRMAVGNWTVVLCLEPLVLPCNFFFLKGYQRSSCRCPPCSASRPRRCG